MLGRTFLILIVAVVALAPMYAPKVLELSWKTFIATPADPKLGTLSRKTVEEMVREGSFAGKHMLVVGGTKGIGRGIARMAAAVGCGSVTIVGRSGGDMVVREMERIGKKRKYAFISADLSTTAGVTGLIQTLAGKALVYDALVMSVGVWPDSSDPFTSEGYNKVAFIDVVARFGVFCGLLEKRLLAKDAQVVSVLASGNKMKGYPDMSFAREFFKANSTFQGGVESVLMTAGVSIDTVIVEASAKNPSLTFVGTMPGLIVTDLCIPTLGQTLADIAGVLMTALGIDMTEDECGLNHLSIMSSSAVRLHKLSLWDHYLVGRTVPEGITLAYRKWLWETLEKILK